MLFALSFYSYIVPNMNLTEGCERMKYFLDEVQRKAAGGTCYFEFQKVNYPYHLVLYGLLILKV